MPATVLVPQSSTRIPIHQPGVIYPEFDTYSGGTGYPPDWNARKLAIKKRDNNRCKVTGCPSLCAIDVHHCTPIYDGGSHRLDNLVCLCQAHHWLLPFHHKVADNADRDRFSGRFSIRRAYWRWNQSRSRRVSVPAHFVRYVKATVSDCERIRDYLGFRCTTCRSDDIHFAHINDMLVCACLGCRTGWELPQLLPEEIGPILASYFAATRNVGTFAFDLCFLGDHPMRLIQLCYVCADDARLAILLPKKSGNGPFKGCSNYRLTGCRNTNQRQQRRYTR